MTEICTNNPTVMTIRNCVSRFILILAGLFLFTFNTILTAHEEFRILPLAGGEAPVLSNIESGELEYSKGSGKVAITGTLTISDKDSRNLRSAVISISSGFNSSEDVLSFTNQNGISGNWNKATGILTLTGSATVDKYQSALRSIKFENTNTLNPSTATRIVSFRVNDGSINSNTVTRNIVILSPNTAPKLTNIETVPIVYCINSGAISISSTVGITDPDNISLASAKVQIFTGYTQNEDFLRFIDQNGINGFWDYSSGTLSLSGESTISNYQKALRSIKYENTNPINLEAGNHNISFVVNDGKDISNSVTRSIVVHDRVSIILTGSAGFCNGEIIPVPLHVDFSGIPPWTFTLMRDNKNDVTFNNISLDPYTFNVNHEGTYRIKSISDANCKGDTVGSGYARINAKASPTAVLSGVDTICPGDTAELQVILTGTAPWSITFRHSGSDQTTINNILSTNYKLRVTKIGTYTLVRVEDDLCKGNVSGTGIVNQHILPTAEISGNAAICQSDLTNLNVVLTGSAPWNYSYRRNAEVPVEILNIVSSPDILPVNRAGTYTLYEVYDNHCKGTISGSATITIAPSPEVSMSGLASAYNKLSSEWVPITGTPSGGTFSGAGVIPYDTSWYFIPALPSVGTHNIAYKYRASPGSCYGYDTVVVRILIAKATLEFDNNRTKYCTNDKSFTITGANITDTPGIFSIEGGVGLEDHHDNTATVTPSLLGVNQYTITYSYFDGTWLSITGDFDIGIKPTADFSWATECFQTGQPVALNSASSLSTFGNIVDTLFFWKIYDSTGYTSDTVRNIIHVFAEPGNHRIELQMQNSYGCTDTVTKTFTLRRTITLNGNAYFEDFETRPIDWQSSSSSEVAVNSWKLGTPFKHGNPPKGFAGAKSPVECWYTDPLQINPPTEQSWVTSPCFDFTGTEKPMVKLWIWRLFNSNRDGANLQATADSGKTWINIGQIGDGVNWYNHYDILGDLGVGKSKSHIGWSSDADGTGNDNKWAEARHSLDMLKGKTEVQFRVTYGSDGTAQGNDGIAFDNFWIGERNRTALIEHFTNSSDDSCVYADSTLNKFIHENELNVIDLQYHTSSPLNDPFYQDNPVIPTAREFYYGVPGVPFAILNGGSKSQYRFSISKTNPLNKNNAIIESLLDNKFDINLTSHISGNTLNVVAQVTARQFIPATELSVRIAVIERKIVSKTGNNGETVFESVVKAMLPGAEGTSPIYQDWQETESRTINQSWDLDNENIYNYNELRVVAFIQNELTNEIYQAAMDTGVIITGIDHPIAGSPTEKSFFVYPNPAERLTFIEFNQETREGINIELFNNLGRLLFTRYIPAGTDKTDIRVEDYPSGFYIIRLVSNNKLVGISKLAISK
jgi:hypothetical protein